MRDAKTDNKKKMAQNQPGLLQVESNQFGTAYKDSVKSNIRVPQNTHKSRDSGAHLLNWAPWFQNEPQ